MTKSLIGYQVLLDPTGCNEIEFTITRNGITEPSTCCVTVRESTQEGNVQSADFEVQDMVIVKPDKVVMRYGYDDYNTKEIDFADDAVWYYCLAKIFAEPFIENPSRIKKEDVVLIYQDDETKELFIGTLFSQETRPLGIFDDSGFGS